MKVRLERLLPWCPFRVSPWRDTPWPIQCREIKDALIRQDLQAEPVGPEGHRLDHIARIAYFVVHPSEDPIQIDVGIPAIGFSPEDIIDDGHHRLAAAFYRGDEEIEADIAGDVEVSMNLLGC